MTTPHEHETQHPDQTPLPDQTQRIPSVHPDGPGPVPAPPSAWHEAPQASAPAGTWSGGPAEPARAASAPRRRLLLPVAATAVTAAVLASLGTAALTGQLDGAPSDSSTAPSTVFGTLGQSSGSSVDVPVASSDETDPDWQAVSSAVAPAVVAIQVTTASGSGEGSGVVIDDEGHIITNNHVVEGANDDTVQVTLHDGRIYEATITGLDPATDLAVVQLVDPPDDLRSAVLTDSDAVVVGEPVMAMGNPLGLSNTATTGIVSAIDRPVSTATSSGTGAPVVTNALQIDAAINPGNSGGPLFNASGEVIGITSSIATLSSGSSQSGSIGLGFAIPANVAQHIGEQLIESGAAEHAFLGVSLSDGTGTADGTTRQGAVVKEVSPSSPASEADLQAGDVVVAIDGDPVTGSESLTGFVRALPADTEVTLTVVRDGEALDVPVTLATKPEDATSTTPTPQPSTDPGAGRGAPDSPSTVPDLDGLFPDEG